MDLTRSSGPLNCSFAEVNEVFVWALELCPYVPLDDVHNIIQLCTATSTPGAINALWRNFAAGKGLKLDWAKDNFRMQLNPYYIYLNKTSLQNMAAGSRNMSIKHWFKICDPKTFAKIDYIDNSVRLNLPYFDGLKTPYVASVVALFVEYLPDDFFIRIPGDVNDNILFKDKYDHRLGQKFYSSHLPDSRIQNVRVLPHTSTKFTLYCQDDGHGAFGNY